MKYFFILVVLLFAGCQNLASLEGLAYGSQKAQALQKKASAHRPLEIKLSKSGIVFRLIPAGEFTMGKNKKKVTLKNDYYMGKFEVTHGQWDSVMDSNPSHFKYVGKNAPMEKVTWHDCQTLIKKLNEQESLEGFELSLPTEVEWEYACRAGTTTSFYTGSTNYDCARAAWCGDNKRKNDYGNANHETHAVGQKVANAFGLYDMHGNVWEWCQEWYSDKQSERVNRGGGWLQDAQYCTSATRSRYAPDDRNTSLGLRLVLRLSPAK
jgi:formylglycine-generating enzyme required for sulfatase activity